LIKVRTSGRCLLYSLLLTPVCSVKRIYLRSVT